MKFYSIKLKKDLKIHIPGFTLIEVMIVIAIVGILTSIGVPNYIKYRERARIAVAITEIKFIEKEIANHAAEKGELPEDLKKIGMEKVLDPWGRPYQYLKIQGVYDVKGHGDKEDKDDRDKPRKDHFLKPVNLDFDLYSKGKDGESQTGFSSSKSQDDVVRANNGGYVGLVSNY